MTVKGAHSVSSQGLPNRAITSTRTHFSVQIFNQENTHIPPEDWQWLLFCVQVDGEDREYSEDGCVKEAIGPPINMHVPESGLKISHTSPDIPLEAQTKVEKNQVHTLARDRVQRQITEPTSSVRSVHASKHSLDKPEKSTVSKIWKELRK